MVRRFEKGIPTLVKDYKEAFENEGKVAIFDFDRSELIAEGDDGADWLDLEMLYEEIKDAGNYRMVIVPEQMRTINLFRRVIA